MAACSATAARPESARARPRRPPRPRPAPRRMTRRCRTLLSSRPSSLGVAWCVAPVRAQPQSASARNLTGAWVPMGAGRGADPKLAPPPAAPIVLKPAYAKAYDARRAADAEATKRGEPPATRRRAVHAVRHAADDDGRVVSDRDSADARTDHDRHRGVQRGAPRLPRSAAAADRRGAARLLRSLGRTLGRRHARHRHGRHQGIGAGLQRACRTATRCGSPSGSGSSRRTSCTTRSRSRIRSCSRSRSPTRSAIAGCRTTRWWSSSARTIASTSTSRAACG